MKKLNKLIKHIFLIISLSFLTFTTGFTQTITNSGLTFSPDTLQVTIGDTISFNISASHNAVEVSETTFNNNGSTSNNGFNIPYGGGSWTADSIKTYYYVCQPHASAGMKGVIIVNPPACNKSLTQQSEGFDPNPLYSTMLWSYDTLSLTNTSDCNIRVRPEFVIAHDSLAIGANDLVLKWYNPYTGAWPAIPYYIDGDGHAVGFWSSSATDTTGQDINQGVTQQIIIRVKFWPTANYGTYSANWTTKEVDLSGNIIQTLATGYTTALSLVDCSAFGVDSVNSSDITCFNDNSGTANIVSIENGSGNTLYNWSNGNTTSSISNLAVGDYYCIVTDTDWQQCSDSISFTITQPDSLTLSISTDTICCYSTSTGFANVTINGGSVPYTYSWSNGATTQNLTNVPSGTYTLTVTDANNCTETLAVAIAEYDTLITTYSATHLLCFGDNNACITTNTTGGASNYTYSWNTGETTANICNLSAGTYTCTITDGCGCTTSISVTINEPAELTSSYTQTNVSCFGVNDGGAIVNFFGGTIGSVPGDTNYILGWSGTSMPVYLPYPQSVFNTSLLPNPYNQVPAGVYPYTVTDLNGCTIYDTITITQPDSLYTTYSTTDFNGYEISCFGGNDGEIDFQVNGGTAPFDNYLNGSLQSSLISSNLTAGSYTDSIEDANGCTAINTIILNEPAGLVSTLTTTNISCNGICDGEIISSNSGGVLPYFYSWTSILDSTEDISNLCAGLYALTINDGNGCVTNSSATITEPSPISFSIDSIFNISTYGGNDGAIYISANGGVGNLTYYWANASIFTSNSEDIDNLMSAIYVLNITDSNSCSLDTFVELTQPSSLSLNLDSATTISCYDSCDASLFISANGGDSTYTYSWTGPNGFAASTANISNLCYGEYILVLDDSITMLIDTFNVYQPQPLTTTLTTDSILCHNGTTQAEINVWGGTQSFDYLWSNLATTYITTLYSGNYTITATDQNGCTITDSISLGNPDSIYTQTSTVNVSCNGLNNGEVELFISGGLTPFNYSDDGGNTYQNSNVFDNLSIGTYTYLITDFNGCLSSAFAEIIQPSPITSITESDSVSCYGNCDGVVYAFASGGNSPYSYDWGGNSSNLCSGNYNVIITDANGCLATNTAIVYEPFPLAINIWINGITIEATSGFDSYQWYYANGTLIPGETSEIYEPLSVGEYYVVVTDGDCEVVSYAINYNISGIDNLDNNISIYPNPTMGILTIEGGSNIQNIIILNTLGNQLLSVENNSNDYSKSEIDLTTFAKGFYFIQVEQNNQIMNYRIVLQ